MNFDALGIRNARSRKLFGLHVRGDSMVNAHVLDGDLAILERKIASPGDIVAALIDGETTLKRLIVENRQTFLRAENEKFRDIHPVEELTIQGVMIALVRNHLN
jgi:repressor LexA